MILEVKDIKKSYGEKEILHGISFKVQSGRAMGFLGRNGAGKSTTIRCMMGVFRQNSGQFLIDNKEFKPEDYRIGYLPEERGMYLKNKVLPQLVYFARLRGGNKEDSIRSAKEWIHFFGLDDYSNKPLETLSKGNQQKIQIAQAFVNDPDILILDEPFSGLDPVNAQIFKNAIADFVQRGKLVIFSSHQMSYVEEVCDDICLIHSGDILLTGSLDDIKRERGFGKLLFKGENVKVNEADTAIKQAFPEVQTEIFDGDSLVIDTKSQYSQEDLLRFITDKGWTIVRFGMFEPSLNDIFISLVGGEEA
ncbi:MAG: ATP-binding cassette domain-containing protein [Eubacteriales bacterium]|nr:ATP-binding cassette domain-containing protein [Eubacteriales bacterium]